MHNYYLICIGYHFTTTWGGVIEDACGGKEKLSEKLMSGDLHGSGLTFDFRSNRIHSNGGFYLGITCILPSTARTRTNPTNRIGGIKYSLLGGNTNKPTATAKKYFVRHYCGYLILYTV